MTRTGQCMCGAVAYRAETGDRVSVCYCKMCQRWASGVFMGVLTESFEVTKGDDRLSVIKSSDWAERGFCSECGSTLWYGTAHDGARYLAAGLFDNAGGMTLVGELYVDKRPSGYAFAGDLHGMTKAEVEAFFSGEGDQA